MGWGGNGSSPDLTCSPQRFPNHLHCWLFQPEIRQIFLVGPGSVGGVATCAQLAALDFATEIDQYVMILRPPIGAGDDSIENLDDLARFDYQPGFFLGFALRGSSERFA